MGINLLLQLTLAFVIGVVCAAPQSAAQSPPHKSTTRTAAPAPQPDAETVRRRADDWLRSCLATWERDTGMTRTEWRASCQRVVRERGESLPDSTTTRKKP